MPTNPACSTPAVSSNTPQSVVRPPTPVPARVLQIRKVETLRNDVNLKKGTLCLEKDEKNPGHYLVAFSFDAAVSGSISIFFLAREDEGYGLTQLKPDLYQVTRVPFAQGLGQNYRQAPECGVNLALFDEKDLLQAGEKREYALVVRLETEPANSPTNSSSENEPAVGAPLPPYKPYSCQITKAVVEKKDDEVAHVRVGSQNIWVDGTFYELQEIYGVESTGAGTGCQGSEPGKECVICMSEPGDTVVVLPCRHMCMCVRCAEILRFKKNRCPICQARMERLLQISAG